MSEENPLPEFTLFDRFPLGEAHRFLAALEHAGIRFEIDSFDGIHGSATSSYGQYGTEARISIHIESTRLDEAQQIHHQLFGDCLPNYDSSFFQQHPPNESP